MDNIPTPNCVTGLFDRSSFVAAVKTAVQNNPDILSAGQYALVYFDIAKFKALNDLFGRDSGDSFLCHTADVIKSAADEAGGIGAHLHADRFCMLVPLSGEALDVFLDSVLDRIAVHDLPYEILCNAGVYVLVPGDDSPDTMIDRAAIACATVKGNYTTRIARYTETIRTRLLDEQEIVGVMFSALEERQFVVYYQPQYNHSTGMLIGAEALVRWIHPVRGLLSPALFIPIFERNGFISKIDLFVFEEACRFQRRCLDENLPMVPVSVNLSRYDLFRPGFLENLENIRKKYNVPTKYMRLELTETAVVGSSDHLRTMLDRLHALDYKVEMDDFGSGYSSLNVLKDFDFDVVKLDMAFLSGATLSPRGGTILSSIVRMVRWLDLPLIAEGVETVEQANYLRSIGCDSVQGYLYAKPMPEEDYHALLSQSTIGMLVPEMNLIETMDAAAFWTPDSLETLIFSNFVGGAAIFEYKDGHAEILRTNAKYLREMGMNMSERDIISKDPLETLSDADRKTFTDMLTRAVESEDEQECETWRRISSACCGDEMICIRSTVRMIGRSSVGYLFYAMIRNITAEKRRFEELTDSERRFKAASEQVNIYYWEYTVATKEMRPCFRCMRDLGLPPLVTNYPEPAIEAGIFPPEVADMYRDWHRQIAAGVPSLEAVIPLTVGRVPFRVRYTTEFDENGHPIKAYGSAALVVD